jgi:hypothetical protein
VWANPTQAALGLLGAVVMPHNLFLHSSLVMTRDIDRTSHVRVREANFYFTIEAVVTLTLSFVINVMVVAVAAQAYLGDSDGRAGGEPMEEVGLSTAARFLSQHYAPFIKYVWAVGLLAAGQSSTMSGTYAGQFVMQGFLDLKVTPWQRVVCTRAAALGPALLVAVRTSASHVPPWARAEITAQSRSMKGTPRGAQSPVTHRLARPTSRFFPQPGPLLTPRGCSPAQVSTTAGAQLDATSDVLNILQSLQLPFAAVPVLVLGHSRRLMGAHATSAATAAAGCVLVAALLACNGYLVASRAPWLALRYARGAGSSGWPVGRLLHPCPTRCTCTAAAGAARVQRLPGGQPRAVARPQVRERGGLIRVAGGKAPAPMPYTLHLHSCRRPLSALTALHCT